MAAPPAHPIPEGSKSFIATVLLAYFFGLFGLDRFYLGKTRSAVIKLATFGGFGYWWIVDLVLTLSGRQRDEWGLRLAGYDRHKKMVWAIIGIFFGSSILIGLVAAAGMAAYDGEGLTTFGWALLGVLAVAVVTTGAVLFVRHRHAGSEPQQASTAAEPLPPRIQIHLDKLKGLRQLYVLNAAGGTQSAAVVAGQIDTLIVNVRELFGRLRTKAKGAQNRRAQAAYDVLLGRLTEALDRDYLVDVLTNPQFWDDAEQRASTVQAAIKAVNHQLEGNIRQLNSRVSLEFPLTLQRLKDGR